MKTILIICLFMMISSNGFARSDSEVPINIEVRPVEGTCSEYFAMLQFEFINQSNQWVKIKNQQLDFGNELLNNTVSIVVGESLIAWNEAYQFAKKRQNIESNLMLEALGFFSNVLSHSSRDKSQILGNAGKYLTAAGITVTGLNKLSASLNVNIFPTSHLLYKEILIPPGFSVARWVLLNTVNNSKDEYVSDLNLSYVSNNNTFMKTLTVRSNNKFSNDKCRWQASISEQRKRKKPGPNR